MHACGYASVCMYECMYVGMYLHPNREAYEARAFACGYVGMHVCDACSVLFALAPVLGLCFFVSVMHGCMHAGTGVDGETGQVVEETYQGQMSGVRIASSGSFSRNRFSLPMSTPCLTRVDDHSYSLLSQVPANVRS